MFAVLIANLHLSLNCSVELRQWLTSFSCCQLKKSLGVILYCMFLSYTYTTNYYYYYYNHFMALDFVQVYPGEPVPER